MAQSPYILKTFNLRLCHLTEQANRHRKQRLCEVSQRSKQLYIIILLLFLTNPDNEMEAAWKNSTSFHPKWALIVKRQWCQMSFSLLDLALTCTCGWHRETLFLPLSSWARTLILIKETRPLILLPDTVLPWGTDVNAGISSHSVDLSTVGAWFYIK